MTDKMRMTRSASWRGCVPRRVRQIAMISGDRRSVANRVSRELGVDRAYAEQLPEGQARGRSVPIAR